jgi:enoyl-CoA hydratase/carnithine racemase
MWERIGRRSIELALQGRLMDAAEAKQLGFIQELVEPSEVVSTAVAVARRLAEQPSTAYRLSKRANLKFDEERFTEAMRMAGEAYRAAVDTGVPQVAIKEFFDKREARKGSNDAS